MLVSHWGKIRCGCKTGLQPIYNKCTINSGSAPIAPMLQHRIVVYVTIILEYFGSPTVHCRLEYHFFIGEKYVGVEKPCKTGVQPIYKKCIINSGSAQITPMLQHEILKYVTMILVFFWKSYLTLQTNVPLGNTRISLLGTVTSWKYAFFSFGKNMSGVQTYKNGSAIYIAFIS